MQESVADKMLKEAKENVNDKTQQEIKALNSSLLKDSLQHFLN